jgi:MOSC domain-containing protein YiiM
MTARIDELFLGPARPLARPGHPDVASGIAKLPQAEPVRLTAAGLDGDEQGDPVWHGGPEKALHHYAAEHYPLWRTRYPDSLVPLQPGAFGENVSSTGMTERTVCIGDIYRIGGALVQVSQGRQPCWRLNRRLGSDDAALAMQTAGCTGWYYRVLEEGMLARHDPIVLVERPCPAWPLARLIAALYPADRDAPMLQDEWHAASQLAPLAPNWRATFARRAGTGLIEDWTRRLHE